MQKKITRSKMEAQVLEAAIECFAESGFDGASARDIAKELGATTMPLYHAFKNKKYLFTESLKEVIYCSFEPERLLLCFYKDQEAQDLPSLLLSALQRWFVGLPRSHSRILIFARLSPNKDWQATAEEAIREVARELAQTITREAAKKPRQKISADVDVAAFAIILLLVHLKATSPPSPAQRETKEQAGNLQSLLGYLIKGLGPAFSD